MKQDIIDLLDRRRLMTVATIRPDGWPQATMVGYANDGIGIYFLVSRASQKFRNIAADNRLSITVGDDPGDLAKIKGLSMSAEAYVISQAEARDAAYRRLLQRWPEYKALPPPDWTASAIIRAAPRDIFIVDFSKGLGHVDSVRIGYQERPTMDAEKPEDWGPAPAGSH